MNRRNVMLLGLVVLLAVTAVVLLPDQADARGRRNCCGGCDYGCSSCGWSGGCGSGCGSCGTCGGCSSGCTSGCSSCTSGCSGCNGSAPLPAAPQKAPPSPAPTAHPTAFVPGMQPLVTPAILSH
jgi:hypothetical protein